MEVQTLPYSQIFSSYFGMIDCPFVVFLLVEIDITTAHELRLMLQNLMTLKLNDDS